MRNEELNTTQGPGDSAWFQTTHWSVVASARDPDDPQAQAALERLCQTYWYPLYVFVRRQGRNAADAEDLVQGFFAKLIEKNYLSGIEREKGRFRSFVLLMFKRYAANEWDRDRREKRGGGREIVSLDGPDTESRYSVEAAEEMPPDRAYERQWALTLLEQVLNQLEAEFGRSGKQRTFEELKVFLSGEKGASYAEVGAKLGMSEGAVKVAVHRLRQRYRELLRLEIANTVSDPDNVEDEIRHLMAALA
jgi:RNA polymerase sigma factor (sigma-70 family)